jgi:hypothetical protein
VVMGRVMATHVAHIAHPDKPVATGTTAPVVASASGTEG